MQWESHIHSCAEQQQKRVRVIGEAGRERRLLSLRDWDWNLMQAGVSREKLCWGGVFSWGEPDSELNYVDETPWVFSFPLSLCSPFLQRSKARWKIRCQVWEKVNMGTYYPQGIKEEEENTSEGFLWRRYRRRTLKVNDYINISLWNGYGAKDQKPRSSTGRREAW